MNWNVDDCGVEVSVVVWIDGIGDWAATVCPSDSNSYSLRGKSLTSNARRLTWCAKGKPSPKGLVSHILVGNSTLPWSLNRSEKLFSDTQKHMLGSSCRRIIARYQLPCALPVPDGFGRRMDLWRCPAMLRKTMADSVSQSRRWSWRSCPWLWIKSGSESMSQFLLAVLTPLIHSTMMRNIGVRNGIEELMRSAADSALRDDYFSWTIFSLVFLLRYGPLKT